VPVEETSTSARAIPPPSRDLAAKSAKKRVAKK